MYITGIHPGDRKFFIAVAFWATGTFLCVLDKLSGGEYVTLCGLVVALFNAGNVGEHFAKRGNNGDTVDS